MSRQTIANRFAFLLLHEIAVPTIEKRQLPALRKRQPHVQGEDQQTGMRGLIKFLNAVEGGGRKWLFDPTAIPSL